jgi:hypothetical protein
VDTWVWNQVGLEFVQVDVQSTIEAQRGGDGANDLRDQLVKMLVVGARDIEVAAADVVDGFVVDEECAVGVLDRAVGRKDSVVWLDD